MGRKGKLFVAGLVVALAVGWVLAAAPGWFPERRSTASEAGQEPPAPDFVLQDLEGGPFRLSEQRGKPVLLIFGTTWCPACREEIPHLKEIHARYAQRGLLLVYINIRESREKVARYAQKHDLPYRSLLDESGAVAEQYGIRGVPALILLDESGRIVGGERLIDQSLANLFKRPTAAPSLPQRPSTSS